MQKVHVRNLFSLEVPWQSSEHPTVEANTTAANFGFTITYPSTRAIEQYKFHLYSYVRGEGELTFTLEFAKTSPIIFKKCHNNPTLIEAIILRIRIGSGLDFRKIQKRFVKFGIECFTTGQGRRTLASPRIQLLSKRRVASPEPPEGRDINLWTCHFRPPPY